MKPVQWIGPFRFKNESDVQHIPDKDDEEIVATVYNGTKKTIWGRCISEEPIIPGDIVEHRGERFGNGLL